MGAGLLLISGMQAQGAPKPLPSKSEALEALNRALALCRGLAVQGGYASAWSNDLKVGKTEHSDSPTVISIQPPGTTTLGPAFLLAYRATGEQPFWRLQRQRRAVWRAANCKVEAGPAILTLRPKKPPSFGCTSQQ